MRPKLFVVRRMDVDAVAPRADGLDAVVAFAEVELGALQRLAHLRQAIEQGGAVGHHQSGDAAQHVGLPVRQMELAHADIDPHQARAGIEKGVAGEAQAGDVIVRRQVLVGDADVDVPEIDDVAEVLGGAIVLLVGHGACSLPGEILSPAVRGLSTASRHCSVAASQSLLRHAGGLDHLAPERPLILDELPRLGCVAAAHQHLQIAEARQDVRFLQAPR